MSESSNSTPDGKQQIQIELETNFSETTYSVKWRLTNFHLYICDPGTSIESDTFTTYFEGTKQDWFLKMCPFGGNEKGFVSLFLHCTSEFTASFKLAILDQTNTEQSVKKGENTKFSANGLGYPQFVNRDTLFEENSKLLVNGALTVLCAITKWKVKNVKHPKGVLGRVRSETAGRLSRDFGDLLKTSRLSDLTIIAGGREFHVHRTILAARSPVFSAMFEHEFKENSSGRVDVPDIGPKTMEALLNFIYTGECQEDIKEVAEDLLLASNKYQLNDLKDICSNDLSARMTNDNAASLLALAELCNAPDLKACVLEFVIYNFKAVTISEEWKNLSATNPCLIVEVKDRVIEKLS